jgi:hypothetical protein
MSTIEESAIGHAEFLARFIGRDQGADKEVVRLAE